MLSLALYNLPMTSFWDFLSYQIGTFIVLRGEE